MNITSNDADRIEGATAYDSSGDKIGKVDRLYLDDATNQPSWVTINTGFFGSSQSFVPLEGARFDGDDLRLNFEKDKVKDAPRVGDDQHLDPAGEDELYAYYGMGHDHDRDHDHADHDHSGHAGHDHDHDHADHADRTRDGDDTAMTLKEERLNVGTETHETGRARLRKYTTTEEQTVSVPVTKERLVVERNPVGDGHATGGRIEDGDDVEEITLREERPVVDKETVAVEEVRVGKEQVTEHEQVSGEVRKEHADIDGDTDGGVRGDHRGGRDDDHRR